MSKGLVTVVIPIYNVEKYIDRCIESVVSQTYENLEILLIDDGSPDNCPKICDEWSEKDERIRVIHKENQGLGMARNTGIENATGEYICFFDGDDYILNQTIEKSYELAINDKSDVVLFGLNFIDKNGQIKNSFAPKDNPRFFTGNEVLDSFLPEFVAPDPFGDGSRKFYMSSCLAIYSMEMIKNCGWRFVSEREIISEDVYSLIDLFSNVKKISILSEKFYCYCENSDSLSHTYMENRYEKTKDCYVKTVELCKQKGYSDNIIHRVSKPYIANTISVMKFESGISIKNLKKIIDDNVLQSVLKHNKKDKVSITRKILFWAVRNKFYLLSHILLRLKS